MNSQKTKCFNDDLIQRYVDNETSEQENIYVKQHMETCGKCAGRIKLQKELSVFVVSQIRQLDRDVAIPPFLDVKNEYSDNFKLKDFLIKLSVACSIVIALFVVTKRNYSHGMPQTIVENVDFDIDANKTLEEQEMVVTVISPDGKVSKISVK